MRKFFSKEITAFLLILAMLVTVVLPGCADPFGFDIIGLNGTVNISGAGSNLTADEAWIHTLWAHNGTGWFRVVGNSTGGGGGAGLWETDGGDAELIIADSLDIQNQYIHNVLNPILAQDAATKKYVDDQDALLAIDLADNATAIYNLQVDLAFAQFDISTNAGDIVTALASIAANAGNITTLQGQVHAQNTDTDLGGLPTKNPPVDDDLIVQRDSASGWALFTSTWTQIKAFLKTYFDTLYATAADLIGINANVRALNTTVSGFADNITDLQGNMTAAQGDITDLQGNMTATQGDITDLQGNITTAQGDITDLQGNMTIAQGNITDLETDMGVAQGNITNLEGYIDTLQGIAIVWVIDGGGSVITTGQKGHLEVPFACTVTSWTVVSDVAGAIQIDVWKDTYANFPPTDADSMCSGKEPKIVATNQKNQDLDITDWTTTSISAGDILAFNVDSISTVTRVTLTIWATRIV